MSGRYRYTVGQISIWYTDNFQGFPLTKYGEICIFIIGTTQLWETEYIYKKTQKITLYDF